MIGQILKEMELITEGQVQEALDVQRKEGGAFGDICINLGFISEDDLKLALESQSGIDIISLDEMEIPEDVLLKVPATLAKTYNIIPIKFEEETLTVAMVNPEDIKIIDELKYSLHYKIQGAAATEESIAQALEKYYGLKLKAIEDIFSNISDADLQFEEIKPLQKQAYNVDEAIDSAPVVKLLNLILVTAIKAHGADIHLEPFENTFKIRYRVDGILYEMESPPLHLAQPLISRIKVLANLNISETRMPQDGRIMLSIGGSPVDLRVSCLPTAYGESVVMRILDRSVSNLNIDNLGLREDEQKLINKLISLPHGIVIVTGPTGSGKTTTLYSCLSTLNQPGVKIITTEDPVEYDIDGIIQCSVNEDIGVTYASLLRTILRQDPDIILVGEIRDLETARIAVESSLTGHIVFSTLHTNDAPSAITRMVDLGVEPYMISATLEAIVAQRLVRKICANCKEEKEPTEEMLIQLDLKPEMVQSKKFCYGRGCDKCMGSGYKGRMAIFEIMLLNEQIKEIVLRNGSTEEIRRVARKQGMRSLFEAGILAIYDGHTTVEEVVKEAMFID